MRGTPDEALVLEVAVPGVASAQTQASTDLKWDKGVTLDLAPNCSDAVAIAIRTPGGHTLACGKATLDWTECDRQEVSMPLSGELEGEVRLTCRFFPGRTPGTVHADRFCRKHSDPVSERGNYHLAGGPALASLIATLQCPPGKRRDSLGRECVDELVLKDRCFTANRDSPSGPVTPVRCDSSGLGVRRVPLRPKWVTSDHSKTQA